MRRCQETGLGPFATRDRAACLRDGLLPVALQSADAPVGIDAHVRREEHKQPALVGHVVQEGAEAALAREGQPAQPAERKALLPARLHQVHELLALVIDLRRQ